MATLTATRDAWVARWRLNAFVLLWLERNPPPGWWIGTPLEWAYAALEIWNDKGFDRRPEPLRRAVEARTPGPGGGTS